MRSYIYAAHFALSITALLLVGGLVWLFTAPFDRHLRILHRVTAWWAFNFALIQPLWGCDIENRELLREGSTYIFVANHQSLADILVLYSLQQDFKWVAKDYLFKVPVLGPIMALNRYVVLPKSVRGIRRAMEQCRKYLTEGVSLFIFPEGTRSPDGEVRDFYDGAFKLSTETGTQIVPIVIDGTQPILPKGSLKFRFGNRIKIRVLEPISPAEFGFNHRRLRDNVRAQIVDNLHEMRGETLAPHVIPLVNSGSTDEQTRRVS